MTDEPNNVTDYRMFQLGRLLQTASPDDVRSLFERDHTLEIAVTETDKMEIERTAKKLGLSVDDYLIRCHLLVSMKLSTLDDPTTH